MEKDPQSAFTRSMETSKQIPSKMKINTPE